MAKRSDVIVFNSDVFTEPTAIVGNVIVSLFVSSNCTDTDFVVFLADTYPESEGGGSVVCDLHCQVVNLT